MTHYVAPRDPRTRSRATRIVVLGAPLAAALMFAGCAATPPSPYGPQSGPVVGASAPMANAPVATVTSPRIGYVQAIREVAPNGTRGRALTGAVVGGVLGGVLGHQVGSGRGNDVATAAGAVGGAIAGNRVGAASARNTRAGRYEITVRLEDGTPVDVIQPDISGIQPGDRVVVDGNRVRPI